MLISILKIQNSKRPHLGLREARQVIVLVKYLAVHALDKPGRSSLSNQSMVFQH